MAEITAAAALVQSGDKAGARRRLEAVWARIAEDKAPMHEMALSHTLADAQDDPADELAWDLRALDAALRVTDGEAERHGQGLSIAAFLPSLHVNLAEDYFKLGDVALSREHLELARGFVGALADDGYGRLIRGGIERLGRSLDARGG